MIHFFKQKPLLKELIPTNFIDIHSHLLPGIDDGARNSDDSISLINQLIHLGFKKIITTPHIIENVWQNTEVSLATKFEEVAPTIAQNCDLELFHYAAEYMMDSHFLKRLNNQRLATIKDEYLLVEMSYLQAPIQLYDIIFELQVAGYIPVLAHPERYTFFHKDFESYKKLKKNGCSFQLNLLSSVGYYGKEVAKVAETLLNEQMIDYAGTDVHHERHIKAFQNKVIINSNATIELQNALDNNHFFIS